VLLLVLMVLVESFAVRLVVKDANTEAQTRSEKYILPRMGESRVSQDTATYAYGWQYEA